MWDLWSSRSNFLVNNNHGSLFLCAGLNKAIISIQPLIKEFKVNTFHRFKIIYPLCWFHLHPSRIKKRGSLQAKIKSYASQKYICFFFVFFYCFQITTTVLHRLGTAAGSAHSLSVQLLYAIMLHQSIHLGVLPENDKMLLKFSPPSGSHMCGWDLPQVRVHAWWKLQPGSLRCVSGYMWWWWLLRPAATTLLEGWKREDQEETVRTSMTNENGQS